MGLLATDCTYQIQEQEQAVLSTLGVPKAVTETGLHFKLPLIQKVHKVNTTIQGFPIGYNQQNNDVVADEGIMITSDYNFIDVDFFVEYRITEPVKYLYTSQQPEDILKSISQSCIRTVIASYTVDDVLTTGKSEIQAKIKDMIMKKTTQLLGLPIMGIKEGMQKGIVTDFMIDANTKKVKYLILREGKSYFFSVVKVEDIFGVGENFVTTPTIENIKALGNTESEMMEAFYMEGTTAVSSNGNIIGTIESYDFDEKTGEIISLDLKDGGEIEGDKIATMANDMVFISEEGAASIPAFTQEVKQEKPQADAPEKAEELTDYQKKQREFLIGRKAGADVQSKDGSFKIEKGTVLTDELIEAAEKADVALELTLNVE